MSADAIMLDSDILEEFLQEFKDDKTAKELIKTIWQGLENVRELGSLLKVEEQIDDVIKRQKDKRLDFFGEGTGKSWEQWKRDLLAALKRYYEKAAQTFDINKQMFANEACKGVQLLDLLEQRYDVVATNPPYMGNRLMDNTLAEKIKQIYPQNSLDIYAYFIERNIEFLKENGYVSMITQQSFMFTSSYEYLRKYVLDNLFLRSVAHLGPHAFEDIEGEKVNTTMFSIIKRKSEGNLSSFIKLTSSQNKSNDLKDIIHIPNNWFFTINQNEFKLVEGSPFAYWINDKIIDVFQKNIKISDVAKVVAGMSTGNNDRFLRFHWEIKTENDTSNKKWITYVKGGELNKYYGNIDTVIDWNPTEIKKFSGARIHGTKYFYKQGLTYTLLSSKGFNIRYLPKDCIFDHNGMCIFPNEPEMIIYLMGFLNSGLNNYLLNILNPTISFTSENLLSLPLVIPNDCTKDKIILLTQNCVDLKKSLLQFAINDREFKQTAIQWGYNKAKGDN
ncbi:MAG: N-6 DNA methylase [Candidatus Methanoperedens sp.]|nr:N-6 DNA methylase [Candidatus Methanoperedens sp.]